MSADEIKRAQLAALDAGEADIAGKMAARFGQMKFELVEYERRLLSEFAKWAAEHSVRSCATKPASVAAFIVDQEKSGVKTDHILDTLSAIERLHDYHKLSNPVKTGIVHAALVPIIKDGPPRSWTKDEGRDWWMLPGTIKAAIARRSRETETKIRQLQNELAEYRKSKPDEPKAVATEKEIASVTLP